MAPQKKLQQKSIKLSPKKKVDVSIFKNNAYIHINDLPKGKSVSLTKKEFTQLNLKSKKIKKFISILEKNDSEKQAAAEKENKKDKDKYVNKHAEKNNDASSSSESESSSDSSSENEEHSD